MSRIQCSFAVAAVVIAGASFTPAPAQVAPEWRIGLVKVVITPAERMPLSGYAARTAQFQDVEQDLFAKIAILEDREKNRGVLVTADLIGFFGELSDEICRRIQEKTGIAREHVLLNASHTHSGPELNFERAVNDENAARIRRYVDELAVNIADGVARAAENLQPAELSFGRGVATFVMNRREFTSRGVVLGVQPSGLVDRSAPVLVARSAGGKPLAVVFGAACHNTTLTGENLLVSGDYAGFAQAEIEEKLPGTQAMFVLGCGGDANPYPRGTMPLAKEHGGELAREVLRLMETKLRPVRGPFKTLFGQVDLPLQNIATRETAERIAESANPFHRDVGKAALARLEEGEQLPSRYTAPLALWQFGDDLTLVAISGETVVDYVKLVEQTIGPLNLWVAGYSNDVFGYLPSARVLAEGGYETRGLIRGGVGLFAPEVDDVIAEKIGALAREAGRPPP